MSAVPKAFESRRFLMKQTFKTHFLTFLLLLSFLLLEKVNTDRSTNKGPLHAQTVLNGPVERSGCM